MILAPGNSDVAGRFYLLQTIYIAANQGSEFNRILLPIRIFINQIMDLVTHVLFGNLTRKAGRVKGFAASAALISATVIPDFGEIIIQHALAKKFDAKFAVYDARTSDIAIASDLGVTWFYDLFHSFFFAFSIFIVARFIFRSKIAVAFSVGLFTHILLDCATHGKVWALKLFFPVSNKRFEILTETLGNWWDWKPGFELPFLKFPFPVICPGIWVVLILLTIFVSYRHRRDVD